MSVAVGRDSPMRWENEGAVVGEEKSCTRVDGAVESVVEEIVVPMVCTVNRN